MASRRGLLTSSSFFVERVTSQDRDSAFEFAQAILGNNNSQTEAVAPGAGDADLPFLHWLADVVELAEVRWDPNKHPRRGTSPNPGWFAVVSGSDDTSRIAIGRRRIGANAGNEGGKSGNNGPMIVHPVIKGKPSFKIWKGPYIPGRDDRDLKPVDLAMAMPTGRGGGKPKKPSSGTRQATRPVPGISAEQADPSN